MEMGLLEMEKIVIQNSLLEVILLLVIMLKVHEEVALVALVALAGTAVMMQEVVLLAPVLRLILLEAQELSDSVVQLEPQQLVIGGVMLLVKMEQMVHLALVIPTHT